VRTIEVRELIAQAGSSKTVVIDEPLSDDAATGLAKLELGAPLHAELTIEGVVEGIFITGGVSGTLALTCSRCLKDFSRPFEVHVDEMFVIEPTEDEYRLDPEGDLDIEPMVRDAVILSLPFSPLHDPDCKGLCERCGGDRNLGECSCQDESTDPRWDALRSIDFEMHDADAG
jgi:uncharacterized protein